MVVLSCGSLVVVLSCGSLVVVLSCLCLVLSCLVLSCLVLSCLVLYCLVVVSSRLVLWLFCLVLFSVMVTNFAAYHDFASRLFAMLAKSDGNSFAQLKRLVVNPRQIIQPGGVVSFADLQQAILTSGLARCFATLTWLDLSGIRSVCLLTSSLARCFA